MLSSEETESDCLETNECVKAAQLVSEIINSLHVKLHSYTLRFIHSKHRPNTTKNQVNSHSQCLTLFSESKKRAEPANISPGTISSKLSLSEPRVPTN